MIVALSALFGCAEYMGASASEATTTTSKRAELDGDVSWDSWAAFWMERAGKKQAWIRERVEEMQAGILVHMVGASAERAVFPMASEYSYMW